MITSIVSTVRLISAIPGSHFAFGVFLLILAIKYVLYLNRPKLESDNMMMGKTVVITGASSGIGKEAAKNMAKRGARIIMGCRNVNEGLKAKEDIEDETGNNDVHVLELDLSNFQSVRHFAACLNRKERCIDVLVHNAAVALNKSLVTREGLELTMATNHYGPFLLTHLLVDLLKRSYQGRIIVVTSGLYKLGSLFDLNNPNPVDNACPPLVYYMSKYANIYFTLELARRLQDTQVTANLVNPGFVVDTQLYKNMPEQVTTFVKIFNQLFAKTPAHAAESIVNAAVNHYLRLLSGKYFSGLEMDGLTEGAIDVNYARKFWHISERLVNLRKDDPRI